MLKWSVGSVRLKLSILHISIIIRHYYFKAEGLKMFNQIPIIKKSLSVKLRNANFFLKLSAKARNFTPPPFRSEHVSEVERCDAQLNIPLCVCVLRSVAHGQSKRSANAPLMLTGKPNPAQITLSH